MNLSTPLSVCSALEVDVCLYRRWVETTDPKRHHPKTSLQEIRGCFIFVWNTRWEVWSHEVVSFLCERRDEKCVLTKVSYFCVKYVLKKCVLLIASDIILLFCNFSKYSPSAATHFRSFLPIEKNVRLRSTLSVCKRHWKMTDTRGGLELNLRPARHFLRCRDKLRSEGARSGKSGGRGKISMFSSARYSCTRLYSWAGALSWRSLIPGMLVFGLTFLWKRLNSASADCL